MSTAAFNPQAGISFTEAAIKHVQREISKKPDCKGIRLYLKTSGCSGFMYETELVYEQKADEQIFNLARGVDLYVPVKDLTVLNGTEVDFITRGLNSMFHFSNPNATGECGCGESFSVS